MPLLAAVPAEVFLIAAIVAAAIVASIVSTIATIATIESAISATTKMRMWLTGKETPSMGGSGGRLWRSSLYNLCMPMQGCNSGGDCLGLLVKDHLLRCLEGGG